MEVALRLDDRLLHTFIDQGLLALDGDVLRVTEAGVPVADGLVERLADRLLDASA